MTKEHTLVWAKSPITTSVQSEQKPIPDFAIPRIAEGENDDRTFDKFFAAAGEELVEELVAGLRQRFIRSMVERYISDDTVSDDTFARGLKQIQDAASVLEDEISFAIQAEISSHVDEGPATSLQVSIAQKIRDRDW